MPDAPYRLNLSNSNTLFALRLRTRIAFLLGAAIFCVASASAQRQLTIPPPSGMINDFAKVVGSDRAAQIEALAQFVRAKSGGEITVVTLPDIAGREVADVALGIGRDWKVGAKAAVGDARRNTGIVVLLVPKETSADGRGYISIQTGNGVEGFIPDAVTGDIRREATPLLQRRDYGGALYLITARLAERYATEFTFSLDSAGVQMPARGRRARAHQPADGGGISPFIALVVFGVLMLVLSRGQRSGCLGFLLGQAVGQAMGGGRWGGGGGFGGGGGGGGGFGGFGGGGGFSGGGSSGSF